MSVQLWLSKPREQYFKFSCNTQHAFFKRYPVLTLLFPIVPMLKNDLKLCVNHQFIAPSLYNQITQLIFITDIFRPKRKCTTFFAGTLCLCKVSRFLSTLLTAHARPPGNWRGAGKRFSGAFLAGTPSPLACHFLIPTTSKCILCRLIPFQTSYPAIK